MKDVVGDSVEDVEIGLRSIIRDTYKKYEYLYQYPEEKSKVSSSYLSDFERFKNFKENKYNVNPKEAKKELKDSIHFLSELLHKYHGQRVYVLVDEYDKPVNYLLEDYLGQEKTPEKDKLIKDIARLISATICVSKDNPYLQKLIFTGIFDTAYKEFGSGCNNIKVYGISSAKFSKSFGFSEGEVKQLVTHLQF